MAINHTTIDPTPYLYAWKWRIHTKCHYRPNDRDLSRWILCTSSCLRACVLVILSPRPSPKKTDRVLLPGFRSAGMSYFNETLILADFYWYQCIGCWLPAWQLVNTPNVIFLSWMHVQASESSPRYICDIVGYHYIAATRSYWLECTCNQPPGFWMVQCYAVLTLSPYWFFWKHAWYVCFVK